MSRAIQIQENPLLGQLMDEYEHGLFRRWTTSKAEDEREALFAQYQAVVGLRNWIDNKAGDIASGAD